MLGLGHLIALLTFFDPSSLVFVPAISIPIWDQYVDLIEWSLDWLAETLQSGGLAIIVFTIGIKTLLLPLTVKSLHSSKAMQELQPKIKELQKKHGKDRQRLTQETMRLYSEHRVNPMAGCLPLLLQIPIFLGLYNAIIHLSRGQDGASAFWNNSFLWLDSLDQADPYHILPLAAAVFQFVQTRMMRPYKQGKITDPQQAMMNTMMNFMPLTVIFFGWTFAAGAVLYWATQSIYSVIQQWFITGWGAMRDWFEWLPEMPEHRRLGYRPPRSLDDVVVVSGDEDGAAPRPRGAMGWLQRRMEESLEQRQAARRPATGAAASETQARADEESEAIAAGAPRAARKSGAGGRNGARRGSGGASTRGQRAKGGRATTTAPVGTASANGGSQAERAEGASRAVVVPRKARPAPGKTEGDGG